MLSQSRRTTSSLSNKHAACTACQRHVCGNGKYRYFLYIALRAYFRIYIPICRIPWPPQGVKIVDSLVRVSGGVQWPVSLSSFIKIIRVLGFRVSGFGVL